MLTQMNRMLLALLVACSSDPKSTADAGVGFGTQSDSGTANECASETKAIYLVSSDADLIRFTPETEDFQIVTRLKCGNPDTLPTSMAIDRRGTAWIRYDDEALITASIKDGSCAITKFTPQLGFRKFGMGFVASAGTDVLFLADSAGKGLATLNTKTLATQLVGPFTGEFFGKKAELTGTGEGKLYGFFPDYNPAKMARIDPASGTTSEPVALTGVEADSEWAFAFYGGDFYAFAAKAGGALPQDQLGSVVTKVRAGIATRLKQLAFRVVGAGVSTCAPTSSPK
jgi:hypothetical protein